MVDTVVRRQLPIELTVHPAASTRSAPRAAKPVVVVPLSTTTGMRAAGGAVVIAGRLAGRRNGAVPVPEQVPAAEGPAQEPPGGDRAGARAPR